MQCLFAHFFSIILHFKLNQVLHFWISLDNVIHIHTSRCWGSIAVTIPQSLAKSTGMHPDDKVSFELDAGRLIISPVSRRKYKLHELLAMQGDEPLLIDKAWDAMPTSGQEVAV